MDTGFRADHVLTTRFTLSGPQWTEERRQAFYPEFLQRIRAIPGVTNAALAMSLPIDGSSGTRSSSSPTSRCRRDRSCRARRSRRSVRRLLRDDGDSSARRAGCSATLTRPRRRSTIVINETLAKALWPGEDAVGKRSETGMAGRQEPVAGSRRRRRRRQVQWPGERHAAAGVFAADAGVVRRSRSSRANGGRPDGDRADARRPPCRRQQGHAVVPDPPRWTRCWKRRSRSSACR